MSAFRFVDRYSSTRMPVFARNIVSTSQPLAAQAGLRMLLQGGNAVDAALATAITLAVVEPTSNGIGSDACAIVWDGSCLSGLNATGRSPADLTPERLRGAEKMPQKGWDSVTVPGAVSGWVMLSERFGRLPFSRLFEPAITYANEGFPVAPITARFWKEVSGEYADYPEFHEAFLPNGRAPLPGEVFRFPEQAATLEAIADTKGGAFYRGDLARRIAEHSWQSGGALSANDLAEHTSDWCDTISQSFGEVELHELPPNGQGLAALLMLAIVDQGHFDAFPVDSADSLHLQIEAMKLAFADAYRYIADPASMHLKPYDLLDADYVSQRSRLVDMNRAQDPGYGTPRPGGTVYLTAADQGGMMVSLIQSNCSNFGSGIVVPGTGISLQNRASGFTLQRRHPNRLAGGKRPLTTIIPGFVTRSGKPLMSLGVMGGPMQPQGHAQVTIRTCRYGQDPQTAIDAPRWRVMGGLDVAIESGYRPSVLESLRQRGHRVTEVDMAASFSFGGAQLIYRLDEGYVAGSDPRKDGQAVGY